MANIFQLASNDQSVYFLGQIFGNVGVALSGTGPLVLGKMFEVLNTALLAIGALMVAYTTIVGVLKTAGEGQFLGQKWDSLWVPLRMVMGIAALMPTGSGYCAIQIVMMWVVVQGVGAADNVWAAVGDYLNSNGSFAPPAPLKNADLYAPSGIQSVNPAITDIYNKVICADLYAKFVSNSEDTTSQATLAPVNSPTMYQIGWTGQNSYQPGQAYSKICGNVSWNSADAGSNTGGLPNARKQALQSAIPILQSVASFFNRQIIDNNACWVTPGADGKCTGGTAPIFFNKYCSPNLNNASCYAGPGHPVDQAQGLYQQILDYAGANFVVAITNSWVGLATNAAGMKNLSSENTVSAPAINYTSAFVLPMRNALNDSIASTSSLETHNGEAVGARKGSPLFDSATLCQNTSPNTALHKCCSLVDKKIVSKTFRCTEFCIDTRQSAGEICASKGYSLVDGIAATAGATGDEATGPMPNVDYTVAKNNGWIFAGAYYYQMAKFDRAPTVAMTNFLKFSYPPATGGTPPIYPAGPSSTGDTDITNIISAISSAASTLLETQFFTPLATAPDPAVAGAPVFKFKASSFDFSDIKGSFDVTPAFGGGSILSLLGSIVSSAVTAAATLGGAAVKLALNIIGFNSFITTLFNKFAASLTPSGSVVNPLVAIANFGNYILNLCENLFLTFLAALAILGFLSTNLSVLGTTVNPMQGIASSMVEFLIPIIIFVLGWGFVIGGALGVYTPLIPYILFTFGAIGWFIGVIESMIAAPIVALGILSPGGQHDIMGRAEQAPLLMLSIFMRPLLMVFGMIGGMLLSYAVISMINFAFQGVMTAIAGDAMGLSEGFFFLVTYTILIITALNKCFSLIHEVPDKVLRWIGHHGDSQGEAQALGEIKGGASAGGQVGQSVMSSAGGTGAGLAGGMSQSYKEGKQSAGEKKGGTESQKANLKPAAGKGGEK